MNVVEIINFLAILLTNISKTFFATYVIVRGLGVSWGRVSWLRISGLWVSRLGGIGWLRVSGLRVGRNSGGESRSETGSQDDELLD